MMINSVAIFALIGVSFANLNSRISGKSGFPDGRIIGGNDASIEEVPYQVSIAVNGRHYCGGSIIAKDWVLTAGHCAGLPIYFYTIRAGSDYADFGGTLHHISLILRYESYTTNKREVPFNDIALFRIRNVFIFDNFHRAIKLYDKNEETKAGTCSVITGWGTTEPSMKEVNSMKLQTVTIPIISEEECTRAYLNFTEINSSYLCTSDPKASKDSCQGDSGGPLVIEGRLAGIVSWGYGCAKAGYPGVYTKVAYYREWIDRSMSTYRGTSSSVFHSSLISIALTTIISKFI